MILSTKGKPLNIKDHFVGRITRKIKNLDKDSFLVLEKDNIDDLSETKFLGILTTQEDIQNLNHSKFLVYNVPSLAHLEDGDIVSVDLTGNIRSLYRINSHQNTLLTTERCNSNCLMCSQPPKDREDISGLYETNSRLISLIPSECSELGLSGGEPTLLGNYFFKLIKQLKIDLPNTEIHVLTNGRSFAWNLLAEELGQIDNKNLMLGIPLYSDYYQLHDYIVQAKNAFDQTILGLHNLNRYNIRIEIRVVLHKLTIPRLLSLAKYIYKNLPFVEHVAFMGLEYIGYTPHNIEKLWIDPYDYQTELSASVEYLAERGMHVSIYNTPLCVLPEKDWKYARKSISDWKNDYLPECKNCSKFEDCGGFFTWNLKKHSEHIKPI